MILNNEDIINIEQAKESNDIIEYRQGCTVSKQYTLRVLFKSDDTDLNKSLRGWMRQLGI